MDQPRAAGTDRGAGRQHRAIPGLRESSYHTGSLFHPNGGILML